MTHLIMSVVGALRDSPNRAYRMQFFKNNLCCLRINLHKRLTNRAQFEFSPKSYQLKWSSKAIPLEMVKILEMHLLTVFTGLLAGSYVVSAQDFLVFATTQRSSDEGTTQAPRPVGDWVLVNNQRTVATMAPFVSTAAPSQQYLQCFGSCPTTSEYNPICGSDMQLYQNEQKFNCARNCGAGEYCDYIVVYLKA